MAFQKGHKVSSDTREKIRQATIRNIKLGIVGFKLGNRVGVGHGVSEEHKSTLRKLRSGTTMSKETRNKIHNARVKQISPFKGKHHSEKTKNHFRVMYFGKPVSSTRATVLRTLNLGRSLSKETRRKQRVATITYKELHGGVCPTVGKNEKTLLDKQERIDGIPILRQCHLHTLGYYVDGYCPENNTVYEVYERRHLRPKVAARDAIRQQEIQSLLGCKFVIIWDR